MIDTLNRARSLPVHKPRAAILPLRLRFWESMKTGEKRWELRKRRLNLNAGDRLAFYVPELRSVAGVALVEGRPKQWLVPMVAELPDRRDGLTGPELLEMFADCPRVWAIPILAATAARHPVPLERMRELYPKWSPQGPAFLTWREWLALDREIVGA